MARYDRRRFALDALTSVLAVAGLVLVVVGGSPPKLPARTAPAPAAVAAAPEGVPAPPTKAPPTAAPAAKATATASKAPPVHLEIPAIGVSTALMQLGLNPDGTVAVPPLSAGAPAGWYRYLASPGEVGPAVILGHVDSAQDGPAVFYRLRELRAGDQVSVRRADGGTAVFTVTEVTEFAKSSFPTDAVYGPVDYPALRLVTCGGSFDRLHRQYRGNVVVFARLTGARAG